jgi:protein-tyrosine phosphatase
MNPDFRIAFVCVGNICRSPTAEAIMKDILRREGTSSIDVSSFASTSWEEGNAPDRRAVSEGRKRGVEIEGVSTVLTTETAMDLDLLLVMEHSNYKYVTSILPETLHHRVRYLASFEDNAPTDAEIIDPYYGSIRGFAECYEQIARSCEKLYEHLTNQLDKN